MEALNETLKISSKSDPKLVAGAIAHSVRNNQRVELIAVGAGAVNQAVKSISIARRYTVQDDIDLICIPAFSQADIGGDQKTLIKFIVESR